MDIYLEKDDGTRVKLKEVMTLDKDCEVLFLMLNNRLHLSDQEQIEQYMSKKIGKKCIVMDAMVDRVLGM